MPMCMCDDNFYMGSDADHDLRTKKCLGLVFLPIETPDTFSVYVHYSEIERRNGARLLVVPS